MNTANLIASAVCGLGQHGVQEPQDRLRDAHGPYRPIEVPTLVTFALRGGPHSRKLTERSEHPDGHGNRKICGIVQLA